MPLLPRDFRLQRGDGAAPPAALVRAVRTGFGRALRADGDLRLRDHRGTRDHRFRTHRPDGERGDRGRVTAGSAHGRAVGAGAAGGADRGERCSGTPLGRRRGVAGDGRPDAGGGPHVDVRALAPGCRTRRTRGQGTAGRREHRSRRSGGVVSGRLPGRGSSETGTGAGRRRAARTGHHQCAGARGRHRRPRCRCACGLPGYRRIVLAAGRPCGPARPGRIDRSDRPRRSSRHVPGAPSRSAAGQTHRTGGDRSDQPVHPGSATVVRGDRAAVVRR